MAQRALRSLVNRRRSVPNDAAQSASKHPLTSLFATCASVRQSHKPAGQHLSARLLRGCSRRGEGGSAPLELVLVTPVLILLVLFVLWAGRGARAGLVSDLAAGEAATVAALYSDNEADSQQREDLVEQVLSARPGLDFLCIGGARPRDLDPDDNGFVDEAWLEAFEPEVPGAARGLGVIGVRFECETDGAVAPLLNIFPTVGFYGQASEVVVIPPRRLLSVAAANADEGNSGDPDAEVLRFLIQLSAPSTQAVEVYYRTTSGSGLHPATAPVDYTEPTTAVVTPTPAVTPAPTGSLTINPGDSSAVVEVEISRDDLYEYDETLSFHWDIRPSDPCLPGTPELDPDIRASGITPITIDCTTGSPTYRQPIDSGGVATLDFWKAQAAIGTINNDDPAPTITVTPPNPGPDEGNPVVFTVEIGPSAVPVNFTAQTLNDTTVGANQATGGPTTCTNCDYHTLTLPTYTITPNPSTATSIPVNVTTIDDNTGEGDETFTLQIDILPETINGVDVAHARPVTASGIGAIVDDEPGISIANAISREDAGPMEFLVTLDRLPSAVVSVDYTTLDGSFTPLATGGNSCSDNPQPDYETATAASLTFDPSDPDPAKRTEQTISVVICDDPRNEPLREYFKVELSGESSNAYLDTDSARGTIEDDDPLPTVSVTGPPSPAVEGETMDFEIALSAASSLPVTVNHVVNDGTAKAGRNDYRIVPPARQTGSFTFLAGETTKPIQVETLRDTDSPEVDETFTVELTSPVHNAQFDTDPDEITATGTITDRPVIELAIGPATALEGEILSFPVTLSDAVNLGFQVEYKTADRTTGGAATATADDDYVAVSGGILAFAPNQTMNTIEVEALRDLVNEVHDETFFVELGNVSSDLIRLNPSVALGTIRNVILRELSIDNAASVTEGQTLIFTARLDQPSTETVTVNYRTSNGSATEPDDYVAKSGTLTFVPNDTVETITVRTNNDRLYNEGTENLFVNLDSSTVQNAEVRDPTAEGEIEDSPRAIISVQDAQAQEGDDLEFIVTVENPPTSGQVTVGYDIRGLSATEGNDYQINPPYSASGDTLTFNAGETSLTIPITTTSGDAYEPDETLRIDLSGPSTNAVLGDPTAIGTITQECVDPDDPNQPPPALGFRVGRVTGTLDSLDASPLLATAVEGEQMPFAVTVDAPFCSASRLAYFGITSRNGTAEGLPIWVYGQDYSTSGFDYHGGAGGRAGDSSRAHAFGRFGDTTSTYTSNPFHQIIYIRTVDDLIDEDEETFTLEANWTTWGSQRMPDHYLGLDSVSITGTIIDNDPLPNLSVSDGAARESNPVEFVMTLDRPSSRAVTVSYQTEEITGSGNYATPGADYTHTSSDRTFSPGETDKSISVPTHSDFDNESPETFNLNLSLTTPLTASLDPADATAVGTIIDTVLPIMSITDVTVVEDAGTAEFTVTLDQASSSAVTVDYETVQLSSGNYSEAGSDYTAQDSTLTFNTNQLSATIQVPIIDDTDSEEAEDFQLRLDTPNGAVLGDNIAQATIIDNDVDCIDPTDPSGQPPTLSVDNESTVEADNDLFFTATLSEPFCQPAAVAVVTGGGTATPVNILDAARPGDYLLWEDSHYSVPAFHTEVVWSAQILEDDLVENNETFNLQIDWASSMPAVYRAQPHVTAVGTIIDDDGDLEVSVNNAQGAEGEILGFVVSLDKPGGRDVTVDYETRDLTATAGDDYTEASGDVEILEGETSAVVPVVTLSDNVSPENDETFQFVLSDPLGALLGDSIGEGTITNVPQPQNLRERPGRGGRRSPRVRGNHGHRGAHAGRR